MTKYSDAFTQADGTLVGHIADGGLGTWALIGTPGGTTTFSTSNNAIALPTDGSYSANGNVTDLITPAYATSADVYYDLLLPSNATDFTIELSQYYFTGGDNVVLFALEPFSYDGATWLFKCLGVTFNNGGAGITLPVALGNPFRFGCYHNVGAGTVQPYTEPAGGGTRTYYGTAQATIKTFTTLVNHLFYLSCYGDVLNAGGYIDNLTIDLDASGPSPGPSSPERSIKLIGTGNNFIGIKIPSGVGSAQVKFK